MSAMPLQLTFFLSFFHSFGGGIAMKQKHNDTHSQCSRYLSKYILGIINYKYILGIQQQHCQLSPNVTVAVTSFEWT